VGDEKSSPITFFFGFLNQKNQNLSDHERTNFD